MNLKLWFPVNKHSISSGKRRTLWSVTLSGNKICSPTENPFDMVGGWLSPLPPQRWAPASPHGICHQAGPRTQGVPQQLSGSFIRAPFYTFKYYSEKMGTSDILLSLAVVLSSIEWLLVLKHAFLPLQTSKLGRKAVKCCSLSACILAVWEFAFPSSHFCQKTPVLVSIPRGI